MNPENIESSCGYLLISVAVTERGVASKVNTFSFDNVNFFFVSVLLKECTWRISGR